MIEIPKTKRVVDDDYIKWIKKQECVIIGGPATAHHLIGYGTGGLAMKSDDYLAFPLSNYYHTGDGGVHRGHKRWEKQWQPQPWYIMDTLEKAFNEEVITAEIFEKYYQICEKLLENYNY